MPMSFNMPLFVWIKTADGVRFATIYLSLNNKCDIDSIYRADEFINKFGLNSTKV